MCTIIIILKIQLELICRVTTPLVIITLLTILYLHTQPTKKSIIVFPIRLCHKYYIYSRSIFIQQLIVYIEGQQFIIIQPNQALEKRFTQNTIYRTILIQFFAENIKQHIEIFYYNFLTYYTQNKRCKQQLSYYKGFSISYIIQILISVGEVYYLQLLLVNITSQYSFKDIRIFKG